MYIEFRLPTEGGYTTQLALVKINVDIDDWVRKYDIPYHKTKIHKYTYRLCLKDDEAYSYFALTWSPKYTVSRQFEFKNPR
jgi:hypothetical protein